ncbi:hypothetical protein FAZ19_09835 [Sphingobacterium alkalisoli]|uniref:Uncharacterized protein n=1 Tax=Sphingobacterium alkalisoli TaxID=1874115 RepID=A0A4U0H1V7_9SPHI|nr:hypothetical protein [Sphingobacterium alkalisoli]TJY65438.1 hypothetical protein FAZ19_09835 [Sphingobacterium alkalisoli]GGH20461.1 hypothetical protein GCM10011418_25690 [Sphingobacterium alkalisoli]
MLYLIITALMGLGSPSITPINNAQITVQVTDNGDGDGGTGGETGTVRPPIPPLPIPVPPICPLPIPPMLP